MGAVAAEVERGGGKEVEGVAWGEGGRMRCWEGEGGGVWRGRFWVVEVKPQSILQFRQL